jgi:hypothetical protein
LAEGWITRILFLAGTGDFFNTVSVPALWPICPVVQRIPEYNRKEIQVTILLHQMLRLSCTTMLAHILLLIKCRDNLIFMYGGQAVCGTEKT